MDGTGGQQQLPGTSAAFLNQLRQRRSGQLNVIWDNAPAHRGEAVREYLRTPELELRLMNLPGYSPDFNADEAHLGLGRERRPLEICVWGPRPWCRRGSATSSPVWPSRSGEVKRRCRTVLQSRAEALLPDSQPNSPPQANAHPTLALV